jgi:hypothetical protein
MRWSITRLAVLGAALLTTSSAGVATTGCSGDGTGPRACSRPDINAPCRQGDTAIRDDDTGTWHVTLRTTTTRQEAYSDGDNSCTRTVWSCESKTCTISGAPSNWTSATAIWMCKYTSGGGESDNQL